MRLLRPLSAAVILLSGCGITACGRESVEIEPQTKDHVEIEANVDRAVATTGDLITYQIRVERSPDYEIEIPESGAEIAGFRITDTRRGSSQIRSGRVVEERWYELRADLVGSYVLPPVSVRFRKILDGEPDPKAPWESAGTSEIFVEVESVLPADGEASDIRGLKPLQRREREIPWFWIGVGTVVLAVAVGLALYFARRKRELQEFATPPHEVAFYELNALRATDFDDPEAVRSFYFSISEIIRLYVEGRFDLNATDLTTDEILKESPDLQNLAPSENEKLSRFLRSTDHVKFAHHEPLQPEIELTYEEALSFVEATKTEPSGTDDLRTGKEIAA